MGFSREALIHSLTSRCDWKDLGQGGKQALDEYFIGGGAKGLWK